MFLYLLYSVCIAVCIDKCEIIANTDSKQSGLFKKKMDSVFREAAAELANEQEALLDAKNKFKAVMQFYQYTPKGSKNLDTVDPNSFFIFWLGFCQDFKVHHPSYFILPNFLILI